MTIVDHNPTVTAAEARENLSEVINRVAFGQERIVLTRHGKALAVMVPVEDLVALEKLEDYLDQQAAKEAWEEYQREGGVPIEVIRRELDAELARQAEQR